MSTKDSAWINLIARMEISQLEPGNHGIKVREALKNLSDSSKCLASSFWSISSHGNAFSPVTCHLTLGCSKHYSVHPYNETKFVLLI